MIEIDGIRRHLERPIWESGDYISDEWFRLIDLATDPNTDSPVVLGGLVSAIRRLNRNLKTTSYLLGKSDFAPVYDNVISQVNEINSDRRVGILHPLVHDVSWSEASGSFQFADSQA